MKCPNCRKKVDEKYVHCPYCGKAIPAKKSGGGILTGVLIALTAIQLATAGGLGSTIIMRESKEKAWSERIKACEFSDPDAEGKGAFALAVECSEWDVSFMKRTNEKCLAYLNEKMENGEYELVLQRANTYRSDVDAYERRNVFQGLGLDSTKYDEIIADANFKLAEETMPQLRKDLIALINQDQTAKGLPKLQESSELQELANKAAGKMRSDDVTGLLTQELKFRLGEGGQLKWHLAFKSGYTTAEEYFQVMTTEGSHGGVQNSDLTEIGVAVNIVREADRRITYTWIVVMG